MNSIKALALASCVVMGSMADTIPGSRHADSSPGACDLHTELSLVRNIVSRGVGSSLVQDCNSAESVIRRVSRDFGSGGECHADDPETAKVHAEAIRLAVDEVTAVCSRAR